MSYIQSNQPIRLPDAAYTVSEADSGKLLLIPALTGARIITLPAVKAGLHYRFMAIDTVGALATITPQTGTINGLLINVSAVPDFDPIQKTAAADAAFKAVSILGDYMDVYCDGTNWHVSGMSQVLGFQ